jgi:uncharacterized membrane protein
MLVTFGTFWAGEGIGIEWPAGDATLAWLAVGYLVSGLIAIRLARLTVEARRGRRPDAPAAEGGLA